MYIDLSTALQVVSGLLSVTGVSIAIVAAIASHRAPLKRDSRIGKLEADVDDLLARIQKLAGRIGRAKQLEEESDEGTFKQLRGESRDAWKLRTRALINQGKRPN